MSQPAVDNLRTDIPGLPWAEQDVRDRRSRLTELLARVAREANEGEDLDAVLRRIVDCLVERLPVAIASIVMLNEACTHFVHEVWAGELTLNVLQPADDWPISKGAAGRCVRTGVAQLIVDVGSDPDYLAGNGEVRSEYLVPIRHRGRLHGVLNIESTQSDFFTAEACEVFDAIAAQVAGTIHLARVVRELENANRKLHALSMQDGLTGIANRRQFDAALLQAWMRLVQGSAPLALLMVDADWFKALNDTAGHLHGDECLRVLARLCTDRLRDEDDLVARFGGEEFVLLLPGRDLEAAVAVGEALREAVERERLDHPASPIAPHVTVSVGAGATWPSEGGQPEGLLLAADRAMYDAKARGRNCVVAKYVG
jgi:diguanylate cyclase (GGDEF)-like protein